MKIQGVKNSSNFVFARNPVMISSDITSLDNSPNGGTFNIVTSENEKQLYEGRFYPPLNVDISEILNAHTSFFPEPINDYGLEIYDVEDFAALEERKACIQVEVGQNVETTDVIVIPGGISKQNYRQLYLNGKDAFTSRFLNYNGNFFFTTRTSSWRIVMKETELYPLYFIIDESKHLQLKAAGKDTHFNYTLSEGIYVLDIDTLRHKFLDSANFISSIFDVFVDGTFSCRIVIERADITKDRYRLKFRNSLGVFEIIELTGKLEITPEYDDAESTSFKRYDCITGNFYTERERVERRLSMTVKTGIKRPDETRFLMDMVSSEEVYLLDLTDLPIKVIPSVEDLTYLPRPDVPQTFSIKLTVVEGETNILQDIIDGDQAIKPRVFSSQFSNQFN